MNNLIRSNLLLASILLCVMFGCSQSTPGTDNGMGAPSEAVVKAAFDRHGLSLVKKVTCKDKITHKNDTGYLTQDQNGKPVLILQGSSYCMGYQMGRLMPEGTARMTREFILKVGESITGILQKDAPELYALIIKQILLLGHEAIDNGAISPSLVNEMQGMADGATAAGYPVTFDDVLVLNEGFDALYAIMITGKLPSSAQSFSETIARQKKILEAKGKTEQLERLNAGIEIKDGKVLFKKGESAVMGCNEFVVSGRATVGGKVFHGRDFMFEPGLYDKENDRYLYPDFACMAIYLPAHGYPFVTPTAAGFVGLATGLNSQGLSMGVDVVRASCTRSTPGMGCLLVVRDIVQHKAQSAPPSDA